MISYRYDNDSFPLVTDEELRVLSQLTTPVPYINGIYLDDPFSKNLLRKVTKVGKVVQVQQNISCKNLRYYSMSNKCIVWSIASDSISDIDKKILDNFQFDFVTEVTYDPSNGISSRGDIWLIIQSFKINKNEIKFNIERSYKSKYY